MGRIFQAIRAAFGGAQPAPPPAPVPPAAPADLRPGETFLQADIARALDYRKEYYKYALGIATALLAFTISFQPTLRVQPENTVLEFIGWIGLGVSVAAGVRVHMVWSKFFATFRKFDNKGRKPDGDKARSRLTLERRILDTVQIVGLVAGVAGVIAFMAVNLKNVALKTDVPAPAASESLQPIEAKTAAATHSTAKPCPVSRQIRAHGDC